MTGPWEPQRRQPERDALLPSRRRLDRERSTAVGRRVTDRRCAAVPSSSHVVRPAGRGPRRRSSTGSTRARRSPRSSKDCGSTSGVMPSRGVAVLVAMLIAVARTLRGPVFFPLRALAAAYIDFFRGLPLIINLMIVGPGCPGAPAPGRDRRPGAARRHRADAHVLGVRRRGVPRRHRVRAPVAARGGTLAGPHQPAGAAACRAPPGGTPPGAAPPQRPRVAAEGHRSGLDRRRDRRRTRRRHHRGPQPQLHAVHRRGTGLRRADHPDDPVHRLGDVPAGRRAEVADSGAREEPGTPEGPSPRPPPARAPVLSVAASARPSATSSCCGTSTWRSPRTP